MDPPSTNTPAALQATPTNGKSQDQTPKQPGEHLFVLLSHPEKLNRLTSDQSLPYTHVQATGGGLPRCKSREREREKDTCLILAYIRSLAFLFFLFTH